MVERIKLKELVGKKSYRIFDLVFAHLEQKNQLAMIFVNEELQAHPVTYEFLLQQSLFQSQLFLSLGAKLQDRVILFLDNNVLFPINFLGANHAGLICVPLSTLLTQSELLFILEDCQPSFVVTEKKYLTLWEQLRLLVTTDFTILCPDDRMREGVGTPTVKKSSANLLPESGTAEDPAYLVYTSGTTSGPKGVLHAQRAVAGKIPALESWFGFQADDIIFHSGKLNWSYTLGAGFLDVLFAGLTVVLYQGPFDARVIFAILKKYSITKLISVPVVYKQLLMKTAMDASALPNLRSAHSASELLEESAKADFLKRFGFEISEGLGMTETSYYLSMPIKQQTPPGSIGKIQPGRRISIVNEDLLPILRGQGQLAIHKAELSLMLRYWRRELPLTGEYFLTGDFVEIDEQGFVFFQGRKDNLVKIKGYRVSLTEVEQTLLSCEIVRECAAFVWVESSNKNNTAEVANNSSNSLPAGLAMAIVPLMEISSLNPKQFFSEVKDFLASRLASYKQPQRFFLTTEIPRSNNGKILRGRLVEQFK